MGTEVSRIVKQCQFLANHWQPSRDRPQPTGIQPGRKWRGGSTGGFKRI